jgi:serine/threonine-protein kinase HipA
VPLDEKGIAAELRAAVSANALGQQADKPLRISVAGAQEKTALLWHEDAWHRPVDATPSTHLFKLPLGRIGNTQIDMPTSVENEWLCAQVVHAFGIDNASCEMASFEDQRVLIVERFDRGLAQGGKWWLRLPQEDLCQALGVPPGQKYESDGGPGVADINALLLGSRRSDTDRQTFFRAQVVFWMLCAIDGHAKNFSVFIEASGRYCLTPLYDVLSAYPIIATGANKYARQKVTMAMAVSGKNRHYKWAQIMPRHWLVTAEKCGLGANVRDVLENLSSQAPKVVSAVESRLPEGFPDDVSIPIFEGLLKAAERLTKFD